jgi:hypothetical protein
MLAGLAKPRRPVTLAQPQIQEALAQVLRDGRVIRGLSV